MKIKRILEKAKPKKVLFDDIGTNWINGEPIFGCLCPSCELALFQFTTDDLNDDIDTDDIETRFKSCFVHHGYMGRLNYCDRCGQKLDWGKYEN